MLSRRSFMWLTGAAAGLSVTRLSAQRGRPAADIGPVPASIAALTSMRDRAKPITNDERRARIEKARRLMAENKIDAIMLTRWDIARLLHRPPLGQQRAAARDPDSRKSATRSSYARRSRRTALANSSRSGRSAQPTCATWQEDESPFERVAQGLKDRGVATGRLGIEETTKFVFADSIAQAAPALKVTSATPVVAGCRMIKDAHETRTDAPGVRGDVEVLRGGVSRAQAGHDAERRRGLAHGRDSAASDSRAAPACRSASTRRCPTGRITPQTIREGTIIMIDGGCSVEGLSVGHHADVRAGQSRPTR